MQVFTPVRRFRPLVSQPFGVPLPDELIIVSFTPSSGGVGTIVTINGNHFTGLKSVSFNGISAAFTVISNTQLLATVPTWANSGPLRVASLEGIATSADDFTFIATEHDPVYRPDGCYLEISAVPLATRHAGFELYRNSQFGIQVGSYDRAARTLPLIWNEVPEATGYRVKWQRGRRVSGVPGAAPISSTTQTATVEGLSHTIADITPGITFVEVQPIFAE